MDGHRAAPGRRTEPRLQADSPSPYGLTCGFTPGSPPRATPRTPAADTRRSPPGAVLVVRPQVAMSIERLHGAGVTEPSQYDLGRTVQRRSASMRRSDAGPDAGDQARRPEGRSTCAAPRTRRALPSRPGIQGVDPAALPQFPGCRPGGCLHPRPAGVDAVHHKKLRNPVVVRVVPRAHVPRGHADVGPLAGNPAPPLLEGPVVGMSDEKTLAAATPTRG